MKNQSTQILYTKQLWTKSLLSRLIVSLLIKGVKTKDEKIEKFVLRKFLKIKSVFKGHEFYLCPTLKRDHYDPSEIITALGGTVVDWISKGH